MFEYFSGHYSWNLSVLMAVQLGGELPEIDGACRPLRPLAERLGAKDDPAAQGARIDAWSGLATGCVDLGQGSDTTMVQICADALQIPMDRISYAPQDSDTSPYNWKTAGSRSTHMTGRAVAVATGEMRDRMFDHAPSSSSAQPLTWSSSWAESSASRACR